MDFKYKLVMFGFPALSKAKRELHTLTDNSSKTFLITLLSLILLFLVGCSNEGTTGGGGADLGSIPTASGTQAQISELSTYVGSYKGTIGNTVKRTSYNSNPQDFGENFSLEGLGNTDVEVIITDNKIYYTGMSGDVNAKVQIYKYESVGNFIASDETKIEGEMTLTYKSYIRITFNSTSEASIYLHMGMKGEGGGYNNAVYTAEI